MILNITTILTALSISAVAAYYSISGLVVIFPGAVASIITMGVVLELGKLVSASWLYRNWKETNLLLRTYLMCAIIILMCITSISVFGYLSKAHLDQAAPAGDSLAKAERIEQQIKQSQKTVDSADRIMLQLDGAVTRLTDYDKISGPNGAIATRKAQQEERQQLQATITEAQERISVLEDEKFALMTDVRKFQVEIGPVRYVAELFYGNEAGNLESAVRLVILMLVVVFDPLAVLLLIAANQSLMLRLPEKNIPPKSETAEMQHKTAEEIPEKDTVFDESSINNYTENTSAAPLLGDAATLTEPVKREGWLGRGGR